MQRLLLMIPFIGIFALAFTAFHPAEVVQKPLVIAYFAGNQDQVNNLPANKLDQVIFSFLHLSGNKLRVENTDQDATIRALVDLKKVNPKLKVLISLGGWGGCETCSDVFSQASNRSSFAKSVEKILAIYGADGIDLDWEYPSIEGFPGHKYQTQDRSSFTSLVKELRKVLGKDKIISFAAGAHDEFLETSVNWESVMPIVDHVNLMTYDLYNGFSSSTGHHTALFSSAQQHLSLDYSVNRLLQKGVSSNKIVVGAAFYGRVWENVTSEHHGLFQKGDFKTSVIYKDLKPFLIDGFKVFQDSISHASYAYNEENRLFITFEDTASVRSKMNYVKAKKLKGIMFWEITQDNQNELLDVIYKEAVR